MAELKPHQDGMEALIYEKLWAEMQQWYQEQRWTNNSLPSFMNDKSIIASESLNFFYGLFVTKIRSVFHF